MKDLKNLIVKANMPTIKGYDLFWWEYDDGSSAAIVIDLETDKVLKSKNFLSKIECKEFRTRIKATAHRKHIAFRKSKLNVNCGLKQLRKISAQFSDKTAATVCYAELKKMLSSCGSDQKSFSAVLTLFSSLLAGYYARFVWSCIDEPDVKVDPHAPILAVSQHDDTYEALKEIVHSVSVDSSPDSREPDELYYKTPPVLPVSISNKRITGDSAACYLSYSKKTYYNNPFPEQYRDTSVLINTTFYKPKELRAFQLHNPWVSTIFFAPQGRDLLMTPIRLNGKVFSRCNSGWDQENVYTLMRCFSARISCKLKKKNRKEFSDQYIKMERLINENNSRRGTIKYRGTKQYWLALQLIALEDMTDFLKTIEAVNEYESERLKAEWFNCMLPNCMSVPEDNRPLAERAAINPQRDCRELVELALREILTHEYLPHFAFVSPKAAFPSTVSGHEIWGYLRN